MTPRLTPWLGTTSTWSVTVPGTTPLRSSGTTTWVQTTSVSFPHGVCACGARPVSGLRRAPARNAVGGRAATLDRAGAAERAGTSSSTSDNAVSASAEGNPLRPTFATTSADGSGFGASPCENVPLYVVQVRRSWPTLVLAGALLLLASLYLPWEKASSGSRDPTGFLNLFPDPLSVDGWSSGAGPAASLSALLLAAVAAAA